MQKGRYLKQVRWLFNALLCSLAFAQGGLAEPSKPEIVLAPGWGELGFEPPVAGTYKLPKIRPATGGAILDTAGKSLDLGDLLGEKVTVLSFIYRTCDDVNGCPLSTMVLNRLAGKVKEHPRLAHDLRLLTLSFDPEFDTPAVMKKFGEGIKGVSANKGRTADWQFLTSSSDEAIQPILDAYQQSVIPDMQTRTDGRKKYSHILRVYLIDRKKQIRNIYNVSFLHPDILINDVLTLLNEEKVGKQTSTKVVSL